MATNNKVQIGDRLFKSSQGKDLGLFNNIGFTNNTLPNVVENEVDNNTNENDNNTTNKNNGNIAKEENDNIVDITTTSTKKTSAKKTNTKITKQTKEFKPYINSISRDIDTDDDKEIKSQIESIIFTAINSVQCRNEKDKDEKSIRVRYFDDKDNSVLLVNVLDEITELIKSMSVNNVKKKNYFNQITDTFICDRLAFITKVCLEERLSPNEIETSMRTFIDSGNKYIEPKILNEYYNTYRDLCVNMVYSRVNRGTYYINELVSEILDIIKLKTNTDISVYINDIILNNADEKIIEEAKSNLYDKKPNNIQINKMDKKKLKKYNIEF